MLRILLLCILLGCSAQANAQLAIDRLWVDLDDRGASRSDLVVRNESDDVYYITVTPAEVVDAGTEAEERETSADPEQLGLLVTPNRLVLRPDEMRAIRVVSLNQDLETDRIYRVNVTPQIGEVSYDQDAADNRGLALKLLAAFDVLVTVRPQDGRPELVAVRDGDGIELKNEGNSNLLLLDGAVCPLDGAALSAATLDHYRAALAPAQVPEGAAEGDIEQPELVLNEQGCVKLPGRRLYAGNSWRIVVDADEQLTFQSRRSAAQDLQSLTVRCGTAADVNSNSAFCRWAGTDTEAGAALSSPAQLQTENLP